MGKRKAAPAASNGETKQESTFACITCWIVGVCIVECFVAGERAAKLKFTRESLQSQDRFQRDVNLDDDLDSSLHWSCSKEEIEANEARLEIIERIEKLGRELRADGSVERWFWEADGTLAEVCCTVLSLPCCAALHACCLQAMAGVNGPLLELLAQTIDYHDCEAIDLLKDGGPLV